MKKAFSLGLFLQLMATMVLANPALDLDPEAYLETSAIVGPRVDQYNDARELLKVRSIVNQDNVDKCFKDEKEHDLFSDQISYFTAMMFKETNAFVGAIGSYYGTSANENAYEKISLISNPLCPVSAKTLAKTLKNVPAQSTINKLNRFASNVNDLRTRMIEGDAKAQNELLNVWGAFFSCLGYTESLGSGDTASSINTAKKYAPAGYRKPAAVEFYEDPSQSSESRLNIGMYQFTPNSSGNIRPCIKAWNALHVDRSPACQVNLVGNQAELIKVLGSSLQSFNAFCGVHKLIQTFAIQVNTTKMSATHPQNIVSKNLVSPKNRCVSPHFSANLAYNHFGPFQNSTGSNMEKFFSCVEKSQN